MPWMEDTVKLPKGKTVSIQIPDTSKFRDHTGWEPEIPFETTMRDLLDYWRDRIARGGRFLTR